MLNGEFFFEIELEIQSISNYQLGLIFLTNLFKGSKISLKKSTTKSSRFYKTLIKK